MILFLDILAAGIPILIFLFFLRKLDRYEPEPIRLIVLHLFWGALGAVTVSLLLSFLVDFLFPDIPEILSVSLFPPIIEEFSKALILIITFKISEYDNLTDGLVYGAAIGLGFGLIENVFYFYANSTNLNSLLVIYFIRTFFTATMHGITTSIIGGALGLYKFSTKHNLLILPILAYFAAVLIHSFWNFSVSFYYSLPLSLLLVIILIFTFIKVIFYSTFIEGEIILRELKDELHLNGKIESALNFVKKNQKKYFLINNKFESNEFFLCCVKLAFRKNQLKLTEDEKILSLCKTDIENLREKIRLY